MSIHDFLVFANIFIVRKFDRVNYTIDKITTTFGDPSGLLELALYQKISNLFESHMQRVSPGKPGLYRIDPLVIDSPCDPWKTFVKAGNSEVVQRRIAEEINLLITDQIIEITAQNRKNMDNINKFHCDETVFSTAPPGFQRVPVVRNTYQRMNYPIDICDQLALRIIHNLPAFYFRCSQMRQLIKESPHRVANQRKENEVVEGFYYQPVSALHSGPPEEAFVCKKLCCLFNQDHAYDVGSKKCHNGWSGAEHMKQIHIERRPNNWQ
jgi:hypothetical protein